MAKAETAKLIRKALTEIVKADGALEGIRNVLIELDDRIDQLEHCIRVIKETAYVDDRGKIMVVPISEDPPKTLKAHIKFWMEMK